MNLKTYGLHLKQIRESKGLSQKQLSINSKVTQSKISNIENGADCQVSTLFKMCDALKLVIELKPITTK